VAALALGLFLSWTLAWGASPNDTPPQLQPGAYELGFMGALDSVEGNAQATATVLGGTYRSLFSGLVGVEVDVGFTHLSSLDRLSLEAGLTWQPVLVGSSLYPFLGVGGGLQQEWLGSFRTPRYPVGINLGLRALFAESAGMRAEYRLRRVLGDPVADYTEHRIFVGISVFFQNQPGG